MIERLWRLGIGVEAGLASASDPERPVTLGLGSRVLRVLIEIEQQDEATASAVAADIRSVLSRVGLHPPPVLLHGQEATVWRFVALAAEGHLSTRVGLEDGCLLAGEAMASDNAALVAVAVSMVHANHRVSAKELASR